MRSPPVRYGAVQGKAASVEERTTHRHYQNGLLNSQQPASCHELHILISFSFFCGTRASHCCGLSRGGAQAPDAQAQRPWLTGPAAPRHVGSSWTGARPCVPCIGRWTLNHCAAWEALFAHFTEEKNEVQRRGLPKVTQRVTV